MMGESTLLVITSSPEKATIIQLMLDESGRYTGILTSNILEAFEFASRTLITVLIKWTSHLYLALGWRMEHLSIHSEYIQWIDGASLTISPGFLVRTLCLLTYQHILSQFPPLADENPSGDFWAPGFLSQVASKPYNHT
jgi:hypothetical protein